MLRAQRRLAESFSAGIDPLARHLVVSQTPPAASLETRLLRRADFRCAGESLAARRVAGAPRPRLAGASGLGDDPRFPRRRVPAPCGNGSVRGGGDELLILGGAKEGTGDPLDDILHRRGTPAELSSCTALVMPAWIEHEPRLALRALSSGIPVIATEACGLSNHPLLRLVPEGDTDALKIALARHRQTPAHARQTPA